MIKKSAVEIIALPAFTDNYIWVLRHAGQVAVVDPGDATPVREYLAQTGERLCAVLVTHYHPDHIGGIAEIIAHHPVPVYGPASENIAEVSHSLRGGEHIQLPEIDCEFDVITLPGHTLGHIAYYGSDIGEAGAVFCGDTLFAAGCGRLFEGTPAQMYDSLNKLAVLPAPTFVYCTHEYTQANLRFALAVEPDNPAIQQRCKDVAAIRAAGRFTVPTRIDLELETNPFLRSDAPAVRAAAAARLGYSPRDAVETFTAIREWKNHF
ncbi:hydroxyacylglutathione hydrolase [Rugosibacter aromaticivorans]|uniref:Hydroxyacylglutathione hydrolase n=1 Tax=Rugosibacter aromaticivorans TaxID=1565605 RepID=A0A0C5JCF8_9PROT|nr:hydroxyacylglutathione hydrolase [Rugosibacter aromaticivorans]AJP49490.1 hydroxyacylglutathione hydrolase [Rugosibacter aromaticivorans]TBR15130.1 MAG: hydroxyacylglutathione hydrolase [Rugosibacter sp.]